MSDEARKSTSRGPVLYGAPGDEENHGENLAFLEELNRAEH